MVLKALICIKSIMGLSWFDETSVEQNLNIFFFPKLMCAIFPRWCTKPMDPSYTAQKLLLYLGNIILNPQSFRNKSWKSTNGGNDQGDVHRCTSLYMLSGSSSHVTCVLVVRHMIGSRPIKLQFVTEVQQAYLLHITWVVLSQSNFTICNWGITSVFVAHVTWLVLWPIKLHSLLPKYNNVLHCITYNQGPIS